jgi:hypothetical protein
LVQEVEAAQKSLKSSDDSSLPHQTSSSKKASIAAKMKVSHAVRSAMLETLVCATPMFFQKNPAFHPLSAAPIYNLARIPSHSMPCMNLLLQKKRICVRKNSISVRDFYLNLNLNVPLSEPSMKSPLFWTVVLAGAAGADLE